MVAVVTCAGLLAGGSAQAEDSTSATTDGVAAGEYAFSLGAEWNVWSPAPGHLGGFPQAFATDHVVDGVTRRKVFVNWAANADRVDVEEVHGSATSDNGGETFRQADRSFNLLGAGRLDDGSLLSIDFKPVFTDEDETEMALQIARSADLGETWTTETAPVTQDKLTFTGLPRVHRGLVQLADGTLLVPMYGGVAGAGMSTVLMQSTDRGASWSVRAQINDPQNGSLTNEAAISRTTDGRLISLMRSAQGSNPVLFQSFSDDDGLTWSTPTAIEVPSGAPNGWVDPAVVLQPNGMLVASYGRPDNHVIVSRDGTGRTWDDHKLVFANAPHDTGPARNHGSSGNTALVTTSANTSVVFGDACANIWGCRELGQLHRVWARRVDAVTPGTGKIDLSSKVHSGSVTLTGDVAPHDPAFPETRIEGAADGSSERHAAARFPDRGRPDELVIELDRTYTLDKIGLMLGHGTAQDADVQLSVDGRAWSRPVVQARDSVDYALRYAEITPREARYVKIVEPAGGTLDAVTEIELYSADTFTFENDAVGSPPRGFTDTRYATVDNTLITGADSERRLMLVDMDPDATATATANHEAVESQRVEMSYAGSAYGSGIVFDVKGIGTDGGDVVAWRFHLRPSGTELKLRAFDGLAWHEVGSVTERPANGVWMPITIDTTSTEARIRIGGEEFTPTAHRWQASTNYTGITFSSWSDSAVNMQHELDDIRVTSLD